MTKGYAEKLTKLLGVFGIDRTAVDNSCLFGCIGRNGLLEPGADGGMHVLRLLGTGDFSGSCKKAR